jgi:hypothetical protein
VEATLAESGARCYLVVGGFCPYLSMPSRRIFDSSVCSGIPSFVPERGNLRFGVDSGPFRLGHWRVISILQSKSRRIRTQWKCWVSLPKKVEVLEMS